MKVVCNLPSKMALIVTFYGVHLSWEPLSSRCRTSRNSVCLSHYFTYFFVLCIFLRNLCFNIWKSLFGPRRCECWGQIWTPGLMLRATAVNKANVASDFCTLSTNPLICFIYVLFYGETVICLIYLSRFANRKRNDVRVAWIIMEYGEISRI